MTRRQADIALFGGTTLALLSIIRFGQGLTNYRDLWDVRTFVLIFWAGALGSAVAVAAVAWLRRTRVADRGRGPFEVLAVALLALHLFLFCFMSFRPVRSAWHAVARKVVLIGMERDLPPPEPLPSGGSL